LADLKSIARDGARYEGTVCLTREKDIETEAVADEEIDQGI